MKSYSQCRTRLRNREISNIVPINRHRNRLMHRLSTALSRWQYRYRVIVTSSQTCPYTSCRRHSSAIRLSIRPWGRARCRFTVRDGMGLSPLTFMNFIVVIFALTSLRLSAAYVFQMALRLKCWYGAKSTCREDEMILRESHRNMLISLHAWQ